MLLEAGGRDWSPYIRVPAAIIRAIGNPALDWMHRAEPDPSRGGRVDLWPAGKVLGGSSAINGMLWVRGQRRDYDGWATSGCTGWGYEELLPYFRRSETCVIGDEAWRGKSGPVHVDGLRSTHPLARVFVEAAVEQGLPLNDDYNGETQEGVAYTQVTQRRGRRFSAARAYVHPLRRNSSLQVLTRARATRLLIRDGRCVGVELQRRGRIEKVGARAEVIVSAGALGSPKLLMQSGVGPADHLGQHGVSVIRDAPEVGGNLLEHPEGMVGIDVNVPTYNVEINSWRIGLHMINWLFRGRGPATSPYPHAVAFFKSGEDKTYVDVQAQFGPYAFTFSEDGVVPYPRPAVSASVNIAHPDNAGRVRLRGPHADDAVRIEHSLLRSEEDVFRLTLGCKRVRDIFNSPTFASYRTDERLPGPSVQTDDEWADYLRQTAFLGYHPVGTCRMGADADSVVDPCLRVRGIHRLRVADASIMPTLISGNTNATAIVIGEKAARPDHQGHQLAVGISGPYKSPHEYYWRRKQAFVPILEVKGSAGVPWSLIANHSFP